VKIGKNNKKKVKIDKAKKSNNISLKWTKKNVFIQAIIGVLIFGTFVLTLINIRNQREFHVDALRSWVNITPGEEIKIEKKKIKCQFKYKAFGETPAFEVATWSTIYYKDSLIRLNLMCSGKLSPVYSSIFPNEVQYADPLKEITGYFGDYTKEKIKDLINKRKIYLFSSISYKDFSEKRHYYSIFVLANLKEEQELEQVPGQGQIPGPGQVLVREPDIIRVEWKVIQTSQERCIEVPELN